MDNTMLELVLKNPYAQLSGAAILAIAAALLVRLYVKKRAKKNQLKNYVNGDFTIDFIPRDSKNQ